MHIPNQITAAYNPFGTHTKRFFGLLELDFEKALVRVEVWNE
ncbi:hypothetical protein [Rhizobium sp. B230/85]|nr:hypothetical protein [Rhizobium sp. B230/85]